ncbi:MAG TPA: DinB family protein [Thermoanaerobaculia bacterium]|nr:DinB family protein [Thermoanaerobaculia bacterium]
MPDLASALVAELEREAAATRRVLERVPADRLEWQPHPKSMTIGQLAMHVASIPGNLSRLARLDGIDLSTFQRTLRGPQSAADLIPALDAGMAEARSFFEELDERAAAAPWRLAFGEREISTVTRAEIIRTLVLNHWYHHRGQLVVYLRLLDIPVPAVYGDSADENPFAGAPDA